MLCFNLFSRRVEVTFGFFFILAVTSLRENRLGLAALMFCAVHELSHLAAMRLFGVRINSIRLYGAGIKISSDGITLLSRPAQAAIYLFGPAANLLLAALFSGDFRAVNLSLAAFNLLPVGYFDGGRLLALILGEGSRAAKIISALTVVMLVLGLIYAVLTSRPNIPPSSFVSLGFILLSAFLDA